jgi:uncharacterized membrane protein YbaN (DUF454 family)
MGSLRKTLFIVGGVFCVVFAFIGIFFPILPTTPFLLLAAFLFARSSDRALHWLENNRMFGRYIRNYRAGRGMRLRDKILTLTLLWATIGITVVYAIENLWVQLLLLGIAIGVTTHLVRINTYQPEN